MNIINFASYYLGSAVYKNLSYSLSELNIDCKTYVSAKIGAREVEVNKNVFVVFNQSVLCRIFFLLKLIKVRTGINSIPLVIKESVVHAHTLYADGVAAYFYAKKNKVELVITLRTTDITLGFKFYFQYKWLAKKALTYAKKIVFVAPAHKVKFQQYFGHYYDNKIIVIPNGIDKFYLEHKLTSAAHKNKNRVALYVGTVNKNKNLKASITAFFNVSINSDDEFRVVGGTYKEYVDIYGELPVNLMHRVNFLGKLPKEQVLEQMRASTVFIMVSHSETFGLVYVEAISQCLPIVYTQGQGVDGYFKDGEFGYRANSHDIDSISQAILKTISDFPYGLGPFIENPANNFSWESIANIYKEQVYK
jgi:glycosyltransferase involved in cell wall biosynthesis